MAEEDAKGPGPSDDLPRADDALEDGYVSNADDDASGESDDLVDAEAGQELDDDLSTPEPFDVVDEEAEELTASSDDEESAADEVQIDDPEQLEDAEADAAQAESSEPRKTSRPARKKKSTAAAATDEDAAEAEAASSVATKTRANAPLKKNAPTRSRAEAEAKDAPKKGGIGTFIGQVVQELKKVVWPTGAQLRQYFIVVLVFVLFMIAFIGLIDMLFTWLTVKWFG